MIKHAKENNTKCKLRPLEENKEHWNGKYLGECKCDCVFALLFLFALQIT